MSEVGDLRAPAVNGGSTDEASRAVDAAVAEHARRGLRVQLVLRGALVVFVVLTIALIPPEQKAAAYAILAAYLVFAVIFTAWARSGSAAVSRWAWLGLFGDVVALAALTLVAGISADETWTSYVLLNGMFLIPVLAATQLRPAVCAAVVVPTVAVFLVAAVATREANEEPWAALVLRAVALVGVAIASIALCRVQQSRVTTIGGLVHDRTRLLDELVRVEDRQRQELAERLHDGALQYVLAARQELEDLGGSADASSVERLDRALDESTRLLRSTVTELHPAVLAHAGLPSALHELAAATARPDRPVRLDAARWPAGVRTPADTLLFGAARELLHNAVTHASATSIDVRLSLQDGSARLVVADDGRGIDDGRLGEALADGHIGLYTQRLRIEATGGTLTLRAGEPSGTVATVDIPVGVHVDDRGPAAPDR